MPRKLTDQDLLDVLELIPNAQDGESRIGCAVMAYHLGLTSSQVRYRIRKLRERGVVLIDGDQVDRVPLLSFTGGEHGYILSSDPKDNAKHYRWRATGALKALHLTVNEAVERFIATRPEAERSVLHRQLSRPMMRIMEDIGDMVAVNNAVLDGLAV